jgi:hypothetical protein
MKPQVTPASEIKSEFMQKIGLPRGNIFLHEVLKYAAKAPSQKDKIEILQAYAKRSDSYRASLKFFVEATYHPDVIFDLPAGTPPYKPLDALDETMAFSNLFNELKKIKQFCNCPAKIQNKLIRERGFVQMLERLAPREAKLLLMIKDKKLDKRIYPTVDEKLFREAFPDWLPGTESKNAQAPA